MKNIFKKISVILVGLLTLVSCNGGYRNNVSFSYSGLEELTTSLSNATFYDGGAKTGAYIFVEGEHDSSLHPTTKEYKFYTSCEKQDKNTMTKDALKINRDGFVIETKLTFKSSDGKSMKTYIINSRQPYDSDIAFADGKPISIGVLAMDDQPYKDLKVNFSVSLMGKSEEGKTTFQRLVTVSTDDNREAAELISRKIAFSLKYYTIGK